MKLKKIIFVIIFLFIVGFVKYKLFILPVDIIYTNDLHGRINVLPKVAYYIKKIKSKNLIVVDAGDFIQGTPESDFFYGESVVDVFNSVGYTAATLGNHEFDFGEQNLNMLKTKSKFVFLGSNIYSPQGVLKPYITNFIIKDFNNIKIGIFGLLTKQTKYIVLPDNIKDVDVINELLVAEKVVNELVYNSVNFIICVSHIGWNMKDNENSPVVNDVMLAKKIQRIDVIIGGHTHKCYNKRIGNTLLLQTGGYGSRFGHLRVFFLKPMKYAIFYKNKFLDVKSLPEEKNVLEVVSGYLDKVKVILDEEIAELKFDLPHYRDKESPLGNLICDIMRSVANADFAVTNSGGIRSSLKKGIVKFKDIYSVCPFDNTIVTVTLSGKEIIEMLEHSVSGKYGILQVSKEVKVVYDTSKPVGQRIQSLSIKNAKINRDKFYRIATNNFIASGGEEYVWFTRHKIVNTNIKLRDAIKTFLQKEKNLTVPSSGRIIFL
ncbi:MAG: 5'-nucleotidase C-terminal domain-containing protein [Endomicrobia bacterium]|nr:5'-nucleotidase C-terminal domain-containing protein [Endomicrobiia bacterium]